jgi:hypothetical protein
MIHYKKLIIKGNKTLFFLSKKLLYCLNFFLILPVELARKKRKTNNKKCVDLFIIVLKFDD